MAVPTLTLFYGHKIPVLGLSILQVEDDPSVVEQAVRDAVDAGYRHFDCAYIDGNEKVVGKALREKIAEGVVKREDLFITSKLWNTFHKREKVVPECRRSVENFGLDYLDLYLIHWPVSEDNLKKDHWPMDEKGNPLPTENGNFMNAWSGMQECVRLGLTKSIGLSNFNSVQIERILWKGGIQPVVNQVECHPNLNQKKLRKFCEARGLAVIAHSPFGLSSQTSAKSSNQKATIEAPEIVAIGKKYGKTPAQIVLRYLIQIGTVPILTLTSKIQMKQNIDIFDFNLTLEDIAAMDKLDCGLRVCQATEFQKYKDYPFDIEF